MSDVILTIEDGNYVFTAPRPKQNPVAIAYLRSSIDGRFTAQYAAFEAQLMAEAFERQGVETDPAQIRSLWESIT